MFGEPPVLWPGRKVLGTFDNPVKWRLFRTYLAIAKPDVLPAAVDLVVELMVHAQL